MKLWKKNVILILIVVAIVIFPLIFFKGAEFAGADGLAGDLITEIAPEYKPWAESIIEPASGEIESLLFALQAAIGAGVIGFVLGKLTSKGKANLSEEKGKHNETNR